MLGRFLEVSLQAPDVPASLEFYESLGFVQATVGDTWSHAYAVVTDGRLFLGLHAHEFSAPTLTWVQPGLAAHAPRLEALGVPVGTVRSRLLHAMRGLRAALDADARPVPREAMR